MYYLLAVLNSGKNNRSTFGRLIVKIHNRSIKLCPENNITKNFCENWDTTEDHLRNGWPNL